MSFSLDDVSVALTTESAAADDEDAGCYGAISNVKGDILLKGKKIGRVSAFLVDRQKIPEGCFFQALDEHSGDMQWVGCALLENRYGRPKLQSLAEYDDPEFDFMYIRTFHVDDEYKKNGASDVGATALRKFLYHPVIKGNLQYGCWKVSSAAYVLDAVEAMTQEEREDFHKKNRERRENYHMQQQQGTEDKNLEEQRLYLTARADANQFLRNGFFQDPALAQNGGENARILVASYGNWTQPPLSHAQAVAVNFVPPPDQMTGNDAKILDAIKEACSRTGFEGRDVNATEFSQLKQVLSCLVSTGGGSLLRSNALHAACANNSVTIVSYILESEPGALNSYDSMGLTPLMVAAQSAAGRSTINGIEETRVIDKLLLAGADKSLQDRNTGMTAYGHFKRSVSGFAEMIMAMTGGGIVQPSSRLQSMQNVESKLYPPGGPSASDLSGGKGGSSGFVDYDQIDADQDREMGVGYDSGDY